MCYVPWGQRPHAPCHVAFNQSMSPVVIPCTERTCWGLCNVLLGNGVENKNYRHYETKPKNGSRKMQPRLSILLPSCNRSTDALLSQRKMLMESRRSVKMNTPTNRSNHRGGHSNEERTYDLSTVDPHVQCR